MLHGIKLVEIPFNAMVKNTDELIDLIDSIEYPNFPYKPLPLISEKAESFKEVVKNRRKEDYKYKKEIFKEDIDLKKERLEKERQFRKEKYKKMKENK